MQLPGCYLKAPIKIAFLAGEPSGDQVGAGLIESLKQTYPDACFVGIGGSQMIAAGLQSLYPMERLSIMGFIEPLKRARELLRLRAFLKKSFIDNPPHVFIGIDSPDFNLPLERALKAKHIPTVHYVSPTIWAWRAGRIKGIKKAVDHMLLIFPFEKQIYDAHHIPASFVGHSLADTFELEPDKKGYKVQLGLDADKKVLAMLLGSRKSEVQRLADDYLKTAQKVLKADPSCQLVVAMHSEALAKEFAKIHVKYPDVHCQVIVNKTHQVLKAADAAMVTSGTATLEATLSKTPHIVLYRTSPLTYQIAKRVIKTPYISMTNILAKKRLVTEYIQTNLIPKTMAHEIVELLSGHRPDLMESFIKIHQSMKRQTNQVAAKVIMDQIKRSSGCPSLPESMK